MNLISHQVRTDAHLRSGRASIAAAKFDAALALLQAEQWAAAAGLKIVSRIGREIGRDLLPVASADVAQLPSH